ncbi:MAG: DUF354 domain-containing protein [Ignavibacteria bacterium]|nr:DUF354 domain-containing protein [Ignavibacteria bacterium]
MKTVWFDFCNPPHVNLFEPLVKFFNSQGYKIKATAREFVETTALLELKNIPFKLIGSHGGKSHLMKLWKLASRDIQLFVRMNGFDISISSSYEAPHISWVKGKKSIVFEDNDISPNWLYAPFVSNVFTPSCVDPSLLTSVGVQKEKIIPYNGFKEDIYVADYQPDPRFLDQIPFSEFVTVRPENIHASYVPKNRTSIIPELIERLTSKGFNVLYLPRYAVDRAYCKESDKVFIPKHALSGLDVCYYSMAVLTGAGTFAREAACMGKPAVSFFAGDDFLSVDKKMFSEKRVLFSRSVDEISDYVMKLNSLKSCVKSNSKEVQDEVFSRLRTICK